MMIRITLLTSALSIAWGVTAFAQQDDFVSPLLGFHEAGVLCALESGVVRDAPDTVAGTTNVIEDAPPFVSMGRLVPAVIGIGFGARAGMDSEIGKQSVLFTVTHPPFAGTGTTSQSFATYIGPRDAPGMTMYQFDFGYELALGDWTITATVGDVTLYETTFTIVPPQTLPELAGVCGYLDLLG